MTLGAVTLFSLGARCYRLTDPNDAKSRLAGLIFDEKYYVNAARVLLHISVPCASPGNCDPYAGSTPGIDPNSEHPPLGKLFIAAGMRVFGDNALGWRIAPVIFGTLAVLGMYWLIRAAAGSRWLGVGGAALMSVDNLPLVHGRIATLDVFVLVFMLAGVALYLNRRPLLGGAMIGVGTCVKLVAPWALLVVVILEVLRVVGARDWRGARWRSLLSSRAVPLLWCAGAAVVVYLGLLQVLDTAVTPYHNPSDPCPGSGSTFANSLVHTRFMLCYAGKLSNVNGPAGIASYPWQWLLDEGTINYYTESVTVSAGGVTTSHPLVSFQGAMSPAIILVALPALVYCLRRALRDNEEVAILAVAWFAGTFGPLVVLSWFGTRTSYLYYMLTVLPGVYVAVARLMSPRTVPRSVLLGWAAVVALGFCTMYPFRTF